MRSRSSDLDLKWRCPRRLLSLPGSRAVQLASPCAPLYKMPLPPLLCSFCFTEDADFLHGHAWSSEGVYMSFMSIKLSGCLVYRGFYLPLKQEKDYVEVFILAWW